MMEEQLTVMVAVPCVEQRSPNVEMEDWILLQVKNVRSLMLVLRRLRLVIHLLVPVKTLTGLHGVRTSLLRELSNVMMEMKRMVMVVTVNVSWNPQSVVMVV